MNSIINIEISMVINDFRKNTQELGTRNKKKRYYRLWHKDIRPNYGRNPSYNHKFFPIRYFLP